MSFFETLQVYEDGGMIAFKNPTDPAPFTMLPKGAVKIRPYGLSGFLFEDTINKDDIAYVNEAKNVSNEFNVVYSATRPLAYKALSAFFNTQPVTGSFSLISKNRELSTLNSSPNTLTIANNGSFVGLAETSDYTSISISGYSSHLCNLYVEFSHNGTDWDSSVPYVIRGNFNEVHRLVNTKSFFRIKITNTLSGTNLDVRFETFKGEFGHLTSNLNSTIQNDADSIVVRPIEFNVIVGEGLYENRRISIKDGFNPDVDSGSGLTQDLHNTGGLYQGFISAAAASRIRVINAADIGTVFYFYLETDTDTDYKLGSIAINGTGNYDLPHNIWRANYMFVELTDTSKFNAGIIYLETTGGIEFCSIPVGLSQSYCAAYSVPAGGAAQIDRITASLRGSSSGQADGYFFVKQWTKSPLLRFPHEYQSGNLYFDDVDYLIRIPEKTDIIPRITAASANNLIPKVSYRLLFTKSLV